MTRSLVWLPEVSDDLAGVHPRGQLEGAVAQGVGQAPELHHVLEHSAVAQQVGRLQALADLGDGLAGVDLEADHLGIVPFHRGEEGVVDAVIAHRHHADDHQRAAHEDQHGPDDLPQPSVPVHAVLPVLVQGAYAVFFRLKERPALPRAALLSPFCHLSLQRGGEPSIPGTACPGRCRPRRPGS